MLNLYAIKLFALYLKKRDEIRMTIASYQGLYESSIAYGMRKALQAEQTKAELEEKAQQLERECADLEREVTNLTENIKELEESATQKRNEAVQKHEEELDVSFFLQIIAFSSSVCHFHKLQNNSDFFVL